MTTWTFTYHLSNMYKDVIVSAKNRHEAYRIAKKQGVDFDECPQCGDVEWHESSDCAHPRGYSRTVKGRYGTRKVVNCTVCGEYLRSVCNHDVTETRTDVLGKVHKYCKVCYEELGEVVPLDFAI